MRRAALAPPGAARRPRQSLATTEWCDIRAGAARVCVEAADVLLKKREKEKRAHRAAEMDSDDEQRGPLDVTFRDLTPTNEPALRRLNSIVFPIRYSVRPRPRTPSSPRGGNKPTRRASLTLDTRPEPASQDKFYQECAAAGRVTQLAYIGDELVGAIACRLELTPMKSAARLYLMTVGVYAPYRNGAIGTRLLRHALNEGSADSFIKDAYLHVHTPNTEAIAFYKRFGFVEDGVVNNYYKRLEPPDAVVLKLNLREWKVRPPNNTQRAHRHIPSSRSNPNLKCPRTLTRINLTPIRAVRADRESRLRRRRRAAERRAGPWRGGRGVDSLGADVAYAAACKHSFVVLM